MEVKLCFSSAKFEIPDDASTDVFFNEIYNYLRSEIDRAEKSQNGGERWPSFLSGASGDSDFNKWVEMKARTNDLWS